MPIPTSKPSEARLAAPASTDTYSAAFARLSSLADKLKNSAAISVDTLVDDVRAARAAHSVCVQRLAAVRAEIDQELAATSEDAGTAA